MAYHASTLATYTPHFGEMKGPRTPPTPHLLVQIFQETTHTTLLFKSYSYVLRRKACSMRTKGPKCGGITPSPPPEEPPPLLVSSPEHHLSTTTTTTAHGDGDGEGGARRGEEGRGRVAKERALARKKIGGRKSRVR